MGAAVGMACMALVRARRSSWPRASPPPTFGSRQEEAQQLGRILRPKPGEQQPHFYSVVSPDTVEQDFALNRQRVLREQGYEYRIVTLGHPDQSLAQDRRTSVSPEWRLDKV